MATYNSNTIQEGNAERYIYVKFTYNNLHLQGNHYDSIVNGQQPDTKNLELLSEVAVNEVVKFKEMTQVHQKDILTYEDDEVITLYEDEDYFDIIPPPKKKTTSLPQIQSTSQQNWTLPEVLTLQDEPESPSQINTPQKTAKDPPDVPSIGRGTIFLHTFDDITPKHVPVIPRYIDGFALYKGKTDYSKWTRNIRSEILQHVYKFQEWVPWLPEIGKYKGSWLCKNPNCAFKSTSYQHQPNHINWKGIHGNRRIKLCDICDHIPECKWCGARKLIDFNPKTEEATVYYLGNHTCWKCPNTEGTQQIRTLKARESSKIGSEKSMAIEEIAPSIEIGDMEGADEEAEYWSDLRASKRYHNEANPNYGYDVNSFDAVGIMKQKTDKRDTYHIYQINNGNLNNSSDYVFKASRRMVQLAISIDVDSHEKSVLQEENAYFDATHMRIHRFKSLGLWMYHPAMRKILSWPAWIYAVKIPKI